MCVFLVRVPFRSQLSASLLPVELSGQTREAARGWLCPEGGRACCRVTGGSACFLSSGHDASFQQPPTLAVNFTFTRRLPPPSVPIAL